MVRLNSIADQSITVLKSDQKKLHIICKDISDFMTYQAVILKPYQTETQNIDICINRDKTISMSIKYIP